MSAAESSAQFTLGNDTLIVYKDVPGLVPSEFYSFRIRSAATHNEWVECFANITRSLHDRLPANVPIIKNKREHYYTYLREWSHTYANIEMSRGSRVEVEISSKNGFKIKGMDFTYANAHPAQKAEQPTVVNNKVYFIINNPAQVTIDINGQMDSTNTGDGYSGPPIHAVTLFANPIIDKPVIGKQGVVVVNPGAAIPANPATYTTLYFAPGVHNIGRNFKVYANKNYYIPGDAIAYGTMNNLNAGPGTNVRIYGSGTLCGDFVKHPDYDKTPGNRFEWKGIVGQSCSNFRVEGICLANPPYHAIILEGGRSTQPQSFCHWVKIITWKGNGDGIGQCDEMQDCFLRCQDDATYVKGDKLRCVFWTDVNGACFCLAGIPTARPLVIEDCDIIYPRHCSTGWNGGRVFAKRPGQKTGGARVNVLFRDIRITDKFQTLETFYMDNGGISGITFKDITSVKTPLSGDNRIIHRWDNITIDNVVLGGKRMASASDFGSVLGVTNLTFINANVSKTSEKNSK